MQNLKASPISTFQEFDNAERERTSAAQYYGAANSNSNRKEGRKRKRGFFGVATEPARK